MKTVQLFTTRQIAAYRAAVEQQLSLSLPKAYLERNTVMGLLEEGEVVGGFVVNHRSPIRALEQIPGLRGLALRALVSGALPAVVELNGLFLLPHVATLTAVAQFWGSIAPRAEPVPGISRRLQLWRFVNPSAASVFGSQSTSAVHWPSQQA